MNSLRLPAEWEEQDGILLAWPHPESDWREILPVVEPVYATICATISRYERVVIVAPEIDTIRDKIVAAGGDATRLILCNLPTNDTWCRDFGPITVEAGGQLQLLDFGFNGWGLKFAADQDNQITGRLSESGIFGTTPRKVVGLILEGGSIESDGTGTLLTTAECLLNRNRNPHLSREAIDAELSSLFGTTHHLWLDHGYLAGDDTDSHIDTLARLCPDETILYVSCDDPDDEHYAELKRMEEQLQTFRTRTGAPYRLLPLPWPRPCFDPLEERLPATYANYLVINGAVLAPTYGDKKDGEALEIIGTAFPGRKVIGIDCSPLILQHGSLHCVTMQLPKGVLAG